MDQKNKSFDWVLIVSIFLIIIGIAIFLFISNEIGLFKSITNKIISPENKYCDYAKETLKWLDSKRDNNGKYLNSVSCNFETKICNIPNEAGLSGHDAIPAIWARYKYIQKTGDKDEISILKKDIDYYYQQLAEMPVQNHFWNCRLLLEINDKKILNQEYLDKIHKICLTSTYLTTDEIKNVYDGKTDSYIVSSPVEYYDWQNPDKTKNLFLKSDKSIDRNYNFFVTFPSDFVARYKYSQNKNDLDIANTYFNKLLQAYYIDNNNFSTKDKCLLAISSLDLYSVNKDQKYLDWAKIVHKIFYIKEGFTLDGANVECALLNQELIKYDQSYNYKSTQDKLLNFFISRYWDGDSGKIYSNDGGFLGISPGTALFKSLQENALLVNLLCP